MLVTLYSIPEYVTDEGIMTFSERLVNVNLTVYEETEEVIV